MKKTLTVLCLMIALAGAGQYPIYQTLPRDSTLVRIKPKYDTLPIIYMYADTARMGFQIEPRKISFWDFGYEVREETGLIPVTSRENNMLFDWVMSYKFVGYLDRQKNPIRKSMIIWQTKTIEK